MSLLARFAYPAAYLVIGVIVVLTMSRILELNGGYFTYTLDDPYIHLSMSEQIAHGSYGVNASEYAAASSSVIYPVLLATGAYLPIHAYFPLIFNLIGLVISIEVLRRFLNRLGLNTTPGHQWVAAALVTIAALTLNLVGVVFTGMEHSLHIAVTMVTIYGLIVFLEEGRVPWWLILAIVLGPLLRYEGLALSLAAVGVLFIRGARRPALLAGAGVIATVGGFTAALIAMGLEPLPSSVLVKSNVAASATDGSVLSLITGIFWKIYATLYTRVGILLSVAWLVTATWVVFIRRPSRQQFSDSKVLVALTLLAVTGAHILAGRYGWFYRYEIYVIVATVMLGLYLMQDGLRALLARSFGKLGVLSVGASALIIIGMPYLNAIAREVPAEANNIFNHQYQLHRFITKIYKEPVAVNDLGWTSYHNPHYVLDLWGLGSETARRLRLKKGVQPTWIKRLVAEHDINLAILYKNWFGGAAPAAWTPVGTLFKKDSVNGQVIFYATRSENIDDLRKKLQTFSSTLPPGVRLDIF